MVNCAWISLRLMLKKCNKWLKHRIKAQLDKIFNITISLLHISLRNCVPVVTAGAAWNQSCHSDYVESNDMNSACVTVADGRWLKLGTSAVCPSTGIPRTHNLRNRSTGHCQENWRLWPLRSSSVHLWSAWRGGVRDQLGLTLGMRDWGLNVLTAFIIFLSMSPKYGFILVCSCDDSRMYQNEWF